MRPMRQTDSAMPVTSPGTGPRKPAAAGFDTPADAAVRTLSLAAVLALAAALLALAFAAPPHASALAFDGAMTSLEPGARTAAVAAPAEGEGNAAWIP